MKNADDVLREKELQLGAIRREVEALRMVASLLIDEAESMPENTSAVGTDHRPSSVLSQNKWH
jgi:hypothetical protein